MIPVQVWRITWRLCTTILGARFSRVWLTDKENTRRKKFTNNVYSSCNPHIHKSLLVYYIDAALITWVRLSSGAARHPPCLSAKSLHPDRVIAKHGAPPVCLGINTRKKAKSSLVFEPRSIHSLSTTNHTIITANICHRLRYLHHYDHSNFLRGRCSLRHGESPLFPHLRVIYVSRL